MNKLILFLPFLFVNLDASLTFSQPTRVLHGQVIDLEDRPVSNIRIRIVDYGEPVIRKSGEFEYELPSEVSQVKLAILDSSLIVLSPPKGILAIPKDEKFNVTIVVGKSEKEAIKDFLVQRDAKLVNLVEKSGGEIKNLVESILQAHAKIHDLKKADLLDEIERDKQRSAILPKIAEAIDKYILEVKDLADAFIFFTDGAKKGRLSAAESIRMAIDEYNKAYDRLETKKDSFHVAITGSWKEKKAEGLKRDLNDVFIEVFDRIHKRILSKQTAVLDIQQAFSKKRYDKKRAANAAEILKDLGMQLKEMVAPLEDRRNQLITALKF